MNLRTKIGVVAVLLSTLTVQAQNIPFRKAEIKETMKKVADWQIANPNKGAEHGDLSWTNAVLYVGMLDWAELAEREDGNKDYFKWLTRIGSRNGWQPDKRMYHADDIAVSQLFIDLYRKEQIYAQSYHCPHGLGDEEPADGRFQAGLSQT